MKVCTTPFARNVSVLNVSLEERPYLLDIGTRFLISFLVIFVARPSTCKQTKKQIQDSETKPQKNETLFHRKGLRDFEMRLKNLEDPIVFPVPFAITLFILSSLRLKTKHLSDLKGFALAVTSGLKVTFSVQNLFEGTNPQIFITNMLSRTCRDMGNLMPVI